VNNPHNQRKPIKDIINSISWRNINVEILFEYLINFPQLIESFDLKETFLDSIENQLTSEREKDKDKKINVCIFVFILILG